MTRIVAGLNRLKKGPLPRDYRSRVICCGAVFDDADNVVYTFTPLISQSVILRQIRLVFRVRAFTGPRRVAFRFRVCTSPINSLAEAVACEEIMPVYINNERVDFLVGGLHETFCWDMAVEYKGIPHGFGMTIAMEDSDIVQAIACFEIEEI